MNSKKFFFVLLQLSPEADGRDAYFDALRNLLHIFYVTVLKWCGASWFICSQFEVMDIVRGSFDK